MIVDGHALIHRAFYAFPSSLRTTDGEVVNAVFGFTSILLKAIKEIKPDYIAVAFDREEKTFRHKAFKAYKAQRVKAAPELYEQIPRVKDVVKILNIPMYDKVGYEGDDILATLSEQHEKSKNNQTIIVTGDLDTLQLVDEQTKIFTPKKGNQTFIYDEAAVKDRYELTPDQMIDFKALAGDSSDNIPGVKGIGEKTAINLLKEFKTLDGVLAAAKKNDPKIKSAAQKKLVDQEKEARQSKELVTIIRDVPGIKLDLKKCSIKDYDRPKAIALFQELQFQSMLNKLPECSNGFGECSGEEKSIENPSLTFSCELVDSAEKFSQFLTKLGSQKSFTFDTETDSLDSVTGELVGISFSWDKSKAYYLALGDNFVGNRHACSSLKPVFENESVKKTGQNLKYDISVLAGYGINVLGEENDSMIISYLLDPGTRAHSLDQLAFSELGYEMQPITDLIGKGLPAGRQGKTQMPFSMVPVKKAAQYSCEDAAITNRLAEKLFGELKKLAKKQHQEKPFHVYYENWDILSLYQKMEMPLVKILTEMERNGISLDTKKLEKASAEFTKRLEKICSAIYEEAGEEFNIASPKQLREILFDKLNLPTDEIRKTKTGYSTAEKELKKLQTEHKIVDKIFEHRELTKLKNTYLDRLPELVNKKTKRVHTSFNQAVTATGRLSSSDPNLQNIPVKSGEGEKIREAFVAKPKHSLLSLDYSQIDLRVLAHYSQDKALLESFRGGEDIHASVASRLFDKSIGEVNKDERRIAKTVNFGIVYGMSAFGLSERLQLDRKKAKEYIERYFAKHPQVEEYMTAIKEYVKKNEYVETLFGRRRYLPEIKSSQFAVRGSAERMAINMPIQGTSSDIMKLAMIAVAKKLESYKDEAKMLLQVHDELLLEVATGKTNEVAKICTKAMQDVCKLDVPLIVNAKSGDNWAQMKES